MENEDGSGLRDYKFYCFNGEPKFLYISEGLENHATAKISFVNLDWTFAPYQRSDYKPFDTLPEKPKAFNEMIKYAAILSERIPCVRVDLYEINGIVYFSELTFTPCGGFMPFKDEKYDYDIGKYLKLPKVCGGGYRYIVYFIMLSCAKEICCMIKQILEKTEYFIYRIQNRILRRHIMTRNVFEFVKKRRNNW